MMEHPSKELLLSNEFYMKAIRKELVPMEYLGLQPLDYCFSSDSSKGVKSTSRAKSLQAVIPTDIQTEALSKTSDDFYKLKKSQSVKHTGSYGHKQRKSTGNKTPLKSPGSYELQFQRPKLVNGVPKYMTPSTRMQKQMQAEIDAIKAEEQRKKHLSTIGNLNFQIINDKGERYIYDNRGFRVKESDYKPPEKKAVQEVFRTENDAVFTGQIVEKTSKHVQRMRSLVEDELRPKPKWAPTVLPFTTVEIKSNDSNTFKRPQSASAIKRDKKEKPQYGSDALPLHLVKTWPEYQYMEVGDVVVTIEHCCDCCDHDWITHHDEQQYEDVSHAIQDALTEIVSKYSVRYFTFIKPIENPSPIDFSRTNSAKGGGTFYNMSSTYRSIDYSKRLGALEVQIAIKTKKDFICHLLHSKLFNGCWPKTKWVQYLAETLLDEAKFYKHPVKSVDGDAVASKSGREIPVPKSEPKQKKLNDFGAPVFDFRRKTSFNFGDFMAKMDGIPKQTSALQSAIDIAVQEAEREEEASQPPVPKTRRVSVSFMDTPNAEQPPPAAAVAAVSTPMKAINESIDSAESTPGTPRSSKHNVNRDAELAANMAHVKTLFQNLHNGVSQDATALNGANTVFHKSFNLGVVNEQPGASVDRASAVTFPVIALAPTVSSAAPLPTSVSETSRSRPTVSPPAQTLVQASSFLIPEETKPVLPTISFAAQADVPSQRSTTPKNVVQAELVCPPVPRNTIVSLKPSAVPTVEVPPTAAAAAAQSIKPSEVPVTDASSVPIEAVEEEKEVPKPIGIGIASFGSGGDLGEIIRSRRRSSVALRTAPQAPQIIHGGADSPLATITDSHNSSVSDVRGASPMVVTTGGDPNAATAALEADVDALTQDEVNVKIYDSINENIKHLQQFLDEDVIMNGKSFELGLKTDPDDDAYWEDNFEV